MNATINKKWKTIGNIMQAAMVKARNNAISNIGKLKK